ncbi:hypothetical protein [Luteimonas sp. 9C]|uniref:hypothetical protein n=1 Tax=Luteimonas sp. 9C TaxID=2653148 RepID=UPI00135A5786|nr:hypothetical protein [Luteimonas sp. 9C]
MLDVVAQLEAAGEDTFFAFDGDQGVLLALSREAARNQVMACVIMTPDGGESEPQQDRPDQNDDHGQDQDDHEASDA